MKVQYFGDVNDYRKFALLKALSGKGFTIGVCWMKRTGPARATIGAICGSQTNGEAMTLRYSTRWPWFRRRQRSRIFCGSRMKP